jgi:hypothetical protein
LARNIGRLMTASLTLSSVPIFSPISGLANN